MQVNKLYYKCIIRTIIIIIGKADGLGIYKEYLHKYNYHKIIIQDSINNEIYNFNFINL